MSVKPDSEVSKTEFLSTDLSPEMEHLSTENRKLSTRKKVGALEKTSRLEANLLAVPLCVLNPKAAYASKTLFYSYKTSKSFAFFEFTRPDSVPFPMPEHAEILCVLIAMFAQDPNDLGEMRFTLSQVLKNAKRSEISSNYSLVKETIWRYGECSAKFHNSWVSKGREDKHETWNGPLIVGNNLFNRVETLELKRNPRKACDPKCWHRIVFHPVVVQSVSMQYVRVFLTETIHSTLNSQLSLVYRYFFRFGDRRGVYRTYTQLMSAFPWRSGLPRFRKWLESHLAELLTMNLIASYEFDSTGCEVKCTPISKIKPRLNR